MGCYKSLVLKRELSTKGDLELKYGFELSIMVYCNVTNTVSIANARIRDPSQACQGQVSILLTKQRYYILMLG